MRETIVFNSFIYNFFILYSISILKLINLALCRASSFGRLYSLFFLKKEREISSVPIYHLIVHSIFIYNCFSFLTVIFFCSLLYWFFLFHEELFMWGILDRVEGKKMSKTFSLCWVLYLNYILRVWIFYLDHRSIFSKTYLDVD